MCNLRLIKVVKKKYYLNNPLKRSIFPVYYVHYKSVFYTFDTTEILLYLVPIYLIK